jgi:hypothetical protein
LLLFPLVEAHFWPLEKTFNIMEQPDIIEHAVGRDKVQVGDFTVTVFAMRPMVDWTVREFSIVPIYFRGHKFYLKKRLEGPAPFACRYELAPWYPQLGMESSLSIVYDEDYVADRDRYFRVDRRNDHLHSALFGIYPLLGFCWSGFKERVLSRIGFEPVDITEASVFIELSFFIVEGIFAGAFHSGFLAALFGRGLLFGLDWTLLLVLPLDCAVRYGHVIRGDAYPGGFLEWLFKRQNPPQKQG